MASLNKFEHEHRSRITGPGIYEILQVKYQHQSGQIQELASLVYAQSPNEAVKKCQEADLQAAQKFKRDPELLQELLWHFKSVRWICTGHDLQGLLVVDPDFETTEKA